MKKFAENEPVAVGQGAQAQQTEDDATYPQPTAHRFDRVELSGAFGDLGTLLPIVVAMILINKLSPSLVFLAFGLFYIVAGYYYRLPIPVQPLRPTGCPTKRPVGRRRAAGHERARRRSSTAVRR